MNRRTLFFGAMALGLAPGGESGGARAADPTGKFRDADPRIKKWVKDLRSRANTNCCDVSDGDWAEEPIWHADRNGYSVLYEGKRLAVPDSAIIDGPNILGRALVWVWRDTAGQPYVRCFMPGTMG